MRTAILITTLFIIIIFAECSSSASDSYEPPKAEGPPELDSYNGEQLSSYTDFRENSIKGSQHVDTLAYTLRVFGNVNEEETYTYQELKSRERKKKVLEMPCVEGWTVNILWEGFSLKDLLDEAGIKNGSKTLLFHCHDGYTTFLSLNYALVNDLLIAHTMNGIPLREERGFPFQLVAQGKLGYKWAKWITGIEVTDLEDVQGYWESAGYPASGDPEEWYRNR